MDNPTLRVFEETGEKRHVMKGDWFADGEGQINMWYHELPSLAEYIIVKPWLPMRYNDLA